MKTVLLKLTIYLYDDKFTYTASLNIIKLKIIKFVDVNPYENRLMTSDHRVPVRLS